MEAVLQHLRRAALLPDGGGLTDGQLLEAFRTRHDDMAFEALVRRLGPMVLGVCRRVVGNRHDAEDAFQAAWLVLVRKAASLRSPEQVGNWLYGVAYRTASQHRRALLRRRRRQLQITELPHAAVPVDDVTIDMTALLDVAISRLPEKYRAAVVLCELEGRPRKDAARALGLPEGTLSSRLAAARKMLARRLCDRALVLLGTGTVAVAVRPAVTAATVQAARATLVRGTAAGVVSPVVANLTEGVLKMLVLGQIKKVCVTTCLIVAALWTGVSVSTGRAQPEPAPTDQRTAWRRELNDLRQKAAELTLRIDGLEQKLENAAPAETDLAWSRLGLRVKEDVNLAELRRTQPQLNGGVRIVALRGNGPAERAKLQVGDILVGLGHWEITNRKALIFTLHHAETADTSRLLACVVRDGQVHRCVVELKPPTAAPAAQGNSTRHFQVVGVDRDKAALFAELAEAELTAAAERWQIRIPDAWSERCRITVRFTGEEDRVGSSTTFTSDRASPVAMHLEGSPVQIKQELHLQMAHVILHCEFGINTPRWVGHGMGLLDADEMEQRRYEEACVRRLANGQAISLGKLLSLRDYPKDAAAVYAEGFTLTRFLVKRKDRTTFLAFVELGMRKDWDTAVRRFYQFGSVEEMETVWRQSLEAKN